jgi:hypothetical protein
MESEKPSIYFPFDTCEKVQEGIAQPYSTGINILNIAVIIYFLTKTKHAYTFYFIFSILLFEIFHTLSHMFHIHRQIQTNLVHSMVYLINATFLYTVYRHSGIPPSFFLMFIICIWIGLDIYAMLHLSMVFYIITQLGIFFSILFFYYSILPTNSKNSIPWLFIIGLLIVCLVYNEMRNCEEMENLYPDAPFHILVEIPGLFFFYILCRSMYTL